MGSPRYGSDGRFVYPDADSKHCWAGRSHGLLRRASRIHRRPLKNPSLDRSGSFKEFPYRLLDKSGSTCGPPTMQRLDLRGSVLESGLGQPQLWSSSSGCSECRATQRRVPRTMGRPLTGQAFVLDMDHMAAC